MVLKKSNTRLNSGATQNFISGGFFFHSDTWAKEQCLSVGINKWLKLYDEKDYKKCLEMLNKYLGWELPTFSSSVRKSNDYRGQSVDVSLKKGKRDQLVVRLKEMMKDVTFLSDIIESTHYDVHFVEVRNNPFRSRCGTRTKEVKATSIIKKEQEKEKGEEKKKFSKKARRDNEDNQEMTDEMREELRISKEISFTVYEPFTVDARFGQHSRRIWRPPWERHCRERRRRNRIEMVREEIKTGIADFQYFPPRDGDAEVDNRPPKSVTYDLLDFVKESQLNKRAKKRSKDKYKQTTDRLFVQDDCPGWLIKTEEFSSFTDLRTASSSWQANSFNFHIQDGDHTEIDQSKQFSEQEDHSSSTNESTAAYEEVPIALDLQTLQQFEQDVIDLEKSWIILNLGHVLEDEIISNKCLPHCFSVRVNENNDSNLIGKKYGLEDSTWQIRLSTANEDWQTVNEEFRRMLSELCEERADREFNIQEVLELAKTVDMRNVKKKTFKTTRLEDESGVSSPWQNVMQTLSKTINTHSLEEAVQILQLKTSDDKEEVVESILNASSECEVCLMPFDLDGIDDKAGIMLLQCSHAFCLKCWRFHIYHSVRRGVFAIPCMRQDCRSKMDETTVATIMPVNFVTSWKKKLLERCIEGNLHSNWCPSTSCHKVAVCPQTSLKSQFGYPVRCDCGHVWCSSCQKDPHWPASCDQFQSFNVLAAKTCLLRVKNETIVQVDVKKCPKCRYPIHKNKGCPHMNCTMCGLHFCWTCLRPMVGHRGSVTECRKVKKHKTYQLKNRLAHNLPIQYFTESVNVRERLQKFRRKDKWLMNVKPRHFKFSKTLLSQQYGATLFKMSMSLYSDCLDFLKRANTVLENCYILLCFTKVNKSKKARRGITPFYGQIERFDFLLGRLDERVIKKPFNEIVKTERESRELLNLGEKMLSRLIKLGPTLQRLPKDSSTNWVDNVDISQILRYK